MNKLYNKLNDEFFTKFHFRFTFWYERIDELIYITILYCQVNQDHNNPKMGFQNVDFNSPSDWLSGSERSSDYSKVEKC